MPSATAIVSGVSVGEPSWRSISCSASSTTPASSSDPSSTSDAPRGIVEAAEEAQDLVGDQRDVGGLEIGQATP